MKPFLIIIKTLIIGYLWSIVFIDGIRVVLLINWHFDIFLRRHWGLLADKWNSGEVVSKSELAFYIILISSIPMWIAGWYGMCVMKWKKFLRDTVLSPVYLFRALTLKRKAPVVKKRANLNNIEPIKKVAVIKKDGQTATQETAVQSQPQQPQAVTQPQARPTASTPIAAPTKRQLPSEMLLKSNVNVQSTALKGSQSSYQPAKKKQEAPLDHALFNFTEDDFDFDFDFEKKEPQKSLDENIPSALVVEKAPEKNVEEKPIDKAPQEKKEQQKPKKAPEKDAHQPQKKKQEAPKPQVKESHTPVLDILMQKGYEIISSPIIKKTKLDYIAVSKNQILLCLVDKEVGEWLADEEKFNDEEPLWFSESSHRISPVRKVDIARDVLKSKLAIGDFNFEIVSYVIIQSGSIINAEDMFDIWNEMDINVTRINRGEPKEIRLFSKSIEPCEEKVDPSTFEKLKKLIYSIA